MPTDQQYVRVQQRQELEMSIIGSVLLSNYHYRLIADFVNEKNFKNKDLSTIWVEIGKVSKSGPVDWHLIARSLEKSNKIELLKILVNCIQMVNSSANVIYWALVLFEADIADKVIDFLNNQEIDQVADSVLYAASREVMEDILDDKKDLLKTLSMCGNYFNAIAPAHPFTLAYAALHNNINKRINKMKQMGKLAAFVDELLAMPNEPWPAAKHRKIKALTEELIKTIIYE